MTEENEETTGLNQPRSRRNLLMQAGAGALTVGAAGWLIACGDDDSETDSGSGDGDTAAIGAVSGTINALCWEGYTDPAFTAAFTEQTGVKVKSTFIGSNDELVTKLRGAPNQYDLISPSCDTTELLIEEDQVQEIDPSQMPNTETILDFFQTAPNVFKDGTLYGSPVAWGFIPLMYDSEQLDEPESWEELWKPEWKDQVAMWQDISMLWTTGLLLGYENVFEMTDEQLVAVKDKLIEQKPNVRKYWVTAGELANLFSNNEVKLGMSFGGVTITQLREEGRKVNEIIPKESATSWFDAWMIPKGAPNPEAAKSFINHFNTPRSQKIFATATGYGICNTNAFDLMSAEYNEVYRLNDTSFVENLDFWQRVPERQKYLDVLNAVVAA